MVIKQIKVNGVAIFSKISLIMLNKISSILSILSFVISLTTIGAGYATYRWVSSPQFEAMMLEKIMGSVNQILPSQIDKKLPTQTSEAIPKIKL